jgi:hypothetical protein
MTARADGPVEFVAVAAALPDASIVLFMTRSPTAG